MGRVFQSVEERRALLEGNPLLSPVTHFFQHVFSIITYEVLLFSSVQYVSSVPPQEKGHSTSLLRQYQYRSS